MTTGAAEARPARKGIFYGWYIVAASIVTNCLVTAAYFQGFQAFVLPILLTFGWTNTQLSGATSARQVESGVVGPVAGFLADQVGPRKLIIAGAVVVGLGLMGLSQTRNLAMYYFFFLLISVGTAGATHGVTWPIIISRWFKKRRGRAIGIAMTGPVLGGVMALPNTYFIGLWGWRPVMFAYGVIVVVVVTLMGLVARDRPEPYGYLPDGEVPDGAGAPRAAQHRAKGQGVTASAPAGEAGFTVRQVLRSRAFWLLSLFLGALGMTSSAFGLWQMPYFVDRGLTEEAAALTAVITVVASGFGRILSGTFLDYVNYKTVLLGVGLLMAFSQFYLVLVDASTVLLAVPFSFAFGYAMGSMVALRPAIGGQLFGTRKLGSVIGLLQGASLASGVAGPIIMGRFFDVAGSYQGAIWFFSWFSLASLLLVMAMRPATRQATRAA